MAAAKLTSTTNMAITETVRISHETSRNLLFIYHGTCNKMGNNYHDCGSDQFLKVVK